MQDEEKTTKEEQELTKEVISSNESIIEEPYISRSEEVLPPETPFPESKGKKKTQNGTKNMIKEIISWVVLLVIAFVLGKGINKYVLMKIEVPSSSMENTLMVGDRLIGNQLAYLFFQPKRGDIVVFPFPDNEQKLYVKRIIGLPGETVRIVDGKVFINDSSEPLEEVYLKEEMYGSFGPYVVPEGKYFMMGDNRNISADARSWENKFVEKDKIQCKVFLRYKPKLEFVK